MGIFKHSLDMLSVPLTPPSTATEAGDVYLIGTVLAILITDTYVASSYAKGGSNYPSTPPQGLKDGQAMVCLPQVRAISERQAGEADIAAGDSVYRIFTAGGDKGKVSTTHSGGTRVYDGVALEAITDEAKGLVAHVAQSALTQ